MLTSTAFPIGHVASAPQSNIMLLFSPRHRPFRPRPAHVLAQNSSCGGAFARIRGKLQRCRSANIAMNGKGPRQDKRPIERASPIRDLSGPSIFILHPCILVHLQEPAPAQPSRHPSCFLFPQNHSVTLLHCSSPLLFGRVYFGSWRRQGYKPLTLSTSRFRTQS